MTELTFEQTPSPMKRVLGNRNFRLLWIGEGISLLGDQFYLIALPWLVLQISGDAVAVGGVLAAASIPRAVFMLIGGAFTDRFSPRLVMLGSNWIRMIVVMLLTGLVFLGWVNLWGIYILAFVFGVVDAFFFPAQSAIIPQVVDRENLQIGNSVIQGTAQLSRFAGPILAGVLISLLGGAQMKATGGSTPMPNLAGIAYAFGIDALTFFISALTLWMINIPTLANEVESRDKKEGVWSAIRSGFLHVWNNDLLRSLFYLIMAINLFINGPVLVGIPVLADTRFTLGAAAFGMLMSAYGGGNLLGIILAGALPKPGLKTMGMTLLTVMCVLGIGLLALGMVSTIAISLIVLMMMGIANGYVSILFLTWLQANTPQSMMGRLASLLMFAAMGLTPISMALSGFFIELHPEMTFFVAGAMMLIVVFVSSLNRNVRNMENSFRA